MEISSIFRRPFLLGEDEILDFDYLTVVKGTRRLRKPNVSSNFTWSGQEVASIGGQGCLYILANSPLFEDNDEEIDEDAVRELDDIMEVSQQVREGRHTYLDILKVQTRDGNLYDFCHSPC